MSQNDISSKQDETYEAYKDDAPLVERLVFWNRPLLLGVFGAITIVLLYFVLQIKPEASFSRMIPTYHPYIKNYIEHQEDLKGETNTVRICVETKNGKDIFNPEYLDVLKNINDDVFFIPGVDRGTLKSLWMPIVRWREVTVEGIAGGPVMDDDYDGSERSLQSLRQKVLKSPYVGSLVANDFKSSIVIASIHDIDYETGEPRDYQELAHRLEDIRKKYENDDIKIYIVGFSKMVGDLIDGLEMIAMFFFLALFIMLGLLYNNTRSFRVTILRGIKSLTAVIWQLGILYLMGYGLNPYSILVPFLIYAIGVSHGIQFFNAMAHEMIEGADKLKAARLGYRLIYKPGLAALFTDCVGFATLMIIRIGVIQDIAIGASIGIAVVALTDLTILPVMMSYIGIGPKTIELVKKRETGTDHPIWSVLARFTQPRYAVTAMFITVIGLIIGVYWRMDLKIGDLDPGAPELRPYSRYNRDNAYLIDHYSISSDIFIVMLKTGSQETHRYDIMVKSDQLKWHLQQLEGVQNVNTITDYIKAGQVGSNEGFPKWLGIPRGDVTRLYMWGNTLPTGGVIQNQDKSLAKIFIYLEDHKAETLERVVALVEDFSKENNTEAYKFLMGAGSAGIEAATNIEVEKAIILLTLLIYAVVFVVCLVTYRSVRGAVCVVTPLVFTSILCEALMAKVGIGVKVATLPVIAVGVGIGVDYGIYIYNKLLYYSARGHKLTAAYYRTLNTTGRAVSFTGITLAVGVATWAFSPIKFQADMGFLLIFMFLWNMVGAMVLLPALARYILSKKLETS